MSEPKNDIQNPYQELFGSKTVVPEELTREKLAELWKTAHDRLIALQQKAVNVESTVDLCKHLLKSYAGYSEEDLTRLPSQDLANLALAELNGDLFLETMLTDDGQLSPFARQNYAKLTEQDLLSYRYMGLTPSDAKEKLANMIVAEYPPETEGQVTTMELTPEDAKRDIIELFNEKFSKGGKPEIVVIPGKIDLRYNHIEVSPSTDFAPPYGGGSYNATFFQRGED